jgi:hypothetical protein
MEIQDHLTERQKGLLLCLVFEQPKSEELKFFIRSLGHIFCYNHGEQNYIFSLTNLLISIIIKQC